jgi:hypothetical protein
MEGGQLNPTDQAMMKADSHFGQDRLLADSVVLTRLDKAPLARLEAEVAMSALLARFERVGLGEGRIRRLPSGVLFGFRALPLVFG